MNHAGARYFQLFCWFETTRVLILFYNLHFIIISTKFFYYLQYYYNNVTQFVPTISVNNVFINTQYAFFLIHLEFLSMIPADKVEKNEVEKFAYFSLNSENFAMCCCCQKFSFRLYLK
jgi:hypothetical protein